MVVVVVVVVVVEVLEVLVVLAAVNRIAHGRGRRSLSTDTIVMALMVGNLIGDTSTQLWTFVPYFLVCSRSVSFTYHATTPPHIPRPSNIPTPAVGTGTACSSSTQVGIENALVMPQSWEVASDQIRPAPVSTAGRIDKFWYTRLPGSWGANYLVTKGTKVPYGDQVMLISSSGKSSTGPVSIIKDDVNGYYLNITADDDGAYINTTLKILIRRLSSSCAGSSTDPCH